MTLSYVWGAHDRLELGRNDFSITSCPRTILDAISCTKALGFQYLWIDRYCIDQATYEGRDQQISVMHLIYKQSAVTLIAACGNDSSYGLPGISRPRIEQHVNETRLPGLHLRETTQREKDISDSIWNHRGWTFHGSMFAKRHLFFTDAEVFYRCSGNAVWETNQHMSNPTRSSMLSTPEALFRWLPVLPPTSSNDTAHTLGALWHRWEAYTRPLRLYSGRQLTFDRDALDAISGVL